MTNKKKKPKGSDNLKIKASFDDVIGLTMGISIPDKKDNKKIAKKNNSDKKS